MPYYCGWGNEKCIANENQDIKVKFHGSKLIVACTFDFFCSSATVILSPPLACSRRVLFNVMPNSLHSRSLPDSFSSKRQSEEKGILFEILKSNVACTILCMWKNLLAVRFVWVCTTKLWMLYENKEWKLIKLKIRRCGDDSIASINKPLCAFFSKSLLDCVMDTRTCVDKIHAIYTQQ